MLLRSIFAIAMVATLLLGCVGMLAGCSKEDEGGSSSSTKPTKAPSLGIGSLDKPEKDKEHYESLTDEEYLQTLITDDVGYYADVLASSFDAILGAGDFSVDNFGLEMALTMQLGDVLLNMLEEGIASGVGLPLDASFLSEIGITYDVGYADGNLQVDLALEISGEDIVSVSVILADDTIYIGVPELNKKYLEFSLADMGIDLDDLSSYYGMVATYMDEITKVLEALPDDDTISNILNRYIALAVEEIDNVVRTEETLVLGDLEQNCTLLGAKIYQQDVLDMIKAILEEAKDDAELKKIIEDTTDAINELGAQFDPYWQDVDGYEGFSDAIDMALERLEYAYEHLDTETFIGVDVAVDDDINIIGFSLTLPGMLDTDFVYLNVTEGNDFNTLFEIPDAYIKITGSGTTNGNAVDAQYTITGDGKDLVIIKLDDVDDKGGTVRIEPTDQLLDMIGFGMSYLPFDDIALELTTDGSNTKISLLDGSDLIIALGMKVAAKDPGSIREPSNTVSAMDQAALMDWVSDFDLDAILGNLKDAGLPSDIANMIEQVLPYITGGF